MTTDSLDQGDVRRTLEEWGVFRDSGQWQALEGLFHPDGVIRVAWYEGHFKGFIERSKASFGKGFAKHVMCSSAVRIEGKRAFAETNVILLGRGELDGVGCYGETHMRYLDCLHKAVSGRWQIADRATVYDHDQILPAVPGGVVAIPEAAIARWPIEYRYLAMRLDARGATLVENLPTKGSELEASIRERGATWLARSHG